MSSRPATTYQVDFTTQKTKISGRLELLLVVLIFVSSIILRVLFIGLTEFKIDQAYWCWEAWKWLNGEEIPLKGAHISVPSVEIAYLGPLTTYLTALAFLIFDPNPESAIFMVAWTNSLAVLFVYLTGRDMFDYRIGLMTALLMSFTPWAFIYSRIIWPQCYLPLTSSVIIFSLYKAIKNSRLIYYFIGGIALGASFQLHPTAFMLIPVVIILVLVNRSKIYGLLTGLFSMFIGYFPMLVFDYFNDWKNLQNYIFIFLNPGRTRPRRFMTRSTYSYTVLQYFFDITGGTGIQRDYGKFYPSSLMFLEFFSFEMIFIAAYLFWISYTWLKFSKRKKLTIVDSPHFLLVIWLFIPLMIHLISGGSIYHHYFIIFYPANFLAIASFMNHFLKLNVKIPLKIENPPLKIPVLKVFTGLIIIFHLITISSLLYQVQTSGGFGNYGSTLKNKKATVTWIINDNDFHDYRVFVKGEYVQDTYEYLFKLYGKEMSEGEPRHYYYILDMVSNIENYATLENYMDAKVDDCQKFGSIIVIKTRS